MAKARTTLSIDEDVLRSTRVAAARRGLRDSDVVEAALRAYLGFAVIDEVRARVAMTEEQAEAFVEAEVYAPRAERRAARRS